MNNWYMQMQYDDYKRLEEQFKNFKALETSHTSVEGYYHKAFRLQVTDQLTIEFQGPMVKKPLEG